MLPIILIPKNLYSLPFCGDVTNGGGVTGKKEEENLRDCLIAKFKLRATKFIWCVTYVQNNQINFFFNRQYYNLILYLSSISYINLIGFLI